MRIFAYSVLLLLAAATAATAQPNLLALKAQSDRVDVIAKVKPAVEAIFARGGQGGGTGVLINDEGYALTNFHVVQPTGPTMQCGLADGVLYDGVLVGWDKVGDVALIKLLPKKEGAKFPFAPLGDSDKVKHGDWSIAMGNPFLLATDFTPTVTYGLVSGVNRYQPPAGLFLEYTDCIQIDTSINPGNSGGPLFNLKGEVIGINGRGSFDKRARINSGVGYAISINQIKNFMGHLHAGLDCDHASLGALVRTETEMAGIGKTKITQILEESDAFKRGLDQEDELVSFAGRSMTSDNHYKNILGIFPRGWRVPLSYQRGENPPTEILVRLMGVQRKEIEDPKQPAPKEDPKQPMPPNGKWPGAQGPAAKYYQPKAGVVNFYFNKQEQDRILNGFKSHSDMSKFDGDWSFDGEVRLLKARAGSPFTADFKEVMEGKSKLTEVKLKIGAFDDTIRPLDPKGADIRKPNGSGGFMAVLYVWRNFLQHHEKDLSECAAGGMEPLYPPPTDGSTIKSWMEQRVDTDVLNTRFGPFQNKWFFSRTDQKILGVEMRMQNDDEPCEVYFSDYRAVNGKQLPHRFQVYYRSPAGNAPYSHYGTFTVNNYKVK